MIIWQTYHLQYLYGLKFKERDVWAKAVGDFLLPNWFLDKQLGGAAACLLFPSCYLADDAWLEEEKDHHRDPEVENEQR